MSVLWDPQMLVGRKIDGRYKLLQLLARGGMGVVFRAVDVVSGEPLAVKVLNPKAALEPDMLARISSEAEALRGIDHPNVVRIVANGIEPNLSPWIAMELVEGENLAVRLLRARTRQERAIPTDEVLTIGLDIALALEVVHGVGLMHRDVKPGNIVTDRRTKRSTLVDFGISKKLPGAEPCPLSITRPGDFIGTTDYAAPEQWTGEAVPRSDVYSLALTMAEALGGEPRVGVDGERRGWPIMLRPLIMRREPERLISLLASSMCDRPELRPTSSWVRGELEAILNEKAEVIRGSVTKSERSGKNAVNGSACALPLGIDPDRETRPPLHESEGQGTKTPTSADTIKEPPRIDELFVEEPCERQTRIPIHISTSHAPVPATQRLRTGARVLAAACVAGIVGGGAWLAIDSEKVHHLFASSLARLVRPAISISAAPLHPPPVANGAPSEPPVERDTRYGHLGQTWTAISDLALALARDMRAPRSERERYLRYDCARLERLAFDVEGLDHPLAHEGRNRLRVMSSKYRQRCEHVLQRARAEARADEE
jgi:serine/threonine protein kinase